MIVSPDVSRPDMLAIQARINEDILSLPADKVAALEDVVRPELIKKVMEDVSDPMHPDIERRMHRYLDFEKHIQRWVDNRDFTKPEVKGNIFAGITNEQISEEDITATRIERIHGGIALIVPREVFQKVVIAQVATNEDTLKQENPTDQEAIAKHLHDFRDIGFSFDAPEYNVFPPGMHIVLVADSNDSEAIQRVIHHETLERLSLLFESHPTLRRRGTSEIVRSALSDLAARIEVNISKPEELDVVTLSMLGISQTEGNKHELEAGTVAYVLEKARERYRALQDIQDDQERQAAQVRLAQEIRFGVNDPIELLGAWGIEKPSDQIAAIKLRPEDYFGPSGDIPHFTARSEFGNGRFVYSSPTLHEKNNDPFIRDFNGLTIDGKNYHVSNLMTTTLYSAVYLLKADDGEMLFAKELIFPVAAALIDSEQSARTLFDVWASTQARLDSPLTLQTFFSRLIDHTRQKKEYEQVENALYYWLDQSMKKYVPNIYNGNASLPFLFKPDAVKQLNSYKDQIFGAVRAALVQFVNSQEATAARAEFQNARRALELEAEALAYMEQNNISNVPRYRTTIQPVGYATPQNPQYRTLILVTKFYPGESLKNLIDTGRIPTQLTKNDDRAAQIAINLLRIAGEYHKIGLVHRDLKPANILVETQNQNTLTIVDWGTVQASYLLPSQMLQEIGTHGYAAPEQYPDSTTLVDKRADIYAIGAILAELLTGENPYQIIEDRIKTHTPFFPTFDLTKIIDQKLRYIVEKATSLKPDDRYQDASEMERDLRDYLSGQPTITIPAVKPPRP